MALDWSACLERLKSGVQWTCKQNFSFIRAFNFGTVVQFLSDSNVGSWLRCIWECDIFHSHPKLLQTRFRQNVMWNSHRTRSLNVYNETVFKHAHKFSNNSRRKTHKSSPTAFEYAKPTRTFPFISRGQACCGRLVSDELWWCLWLVRLFVRVCEMACPRTSIDGKHVMYRIVECGRGIWAVQLCTSWMLFHCLWIVNNLIESHRI